MWLVTATSGRGRGMSRGLDTKREIALLAEKVSGSQERLLLGVSCLVG